jgi:hypothetical protein
MPPVATPGAVRALVHGQRSRLHFLLAVQVDNVFSALQVVSLDGHGRGTPQGVVSIIVPPSIVSGLAQLVRMLVRLLVREQRDVGGGEGERRPVRLPVVGERVGLSLQDGLGFRTLEIDSRRRHVRAMIKSLSTQNCLAKLKMDLGKSKGGPMRRFSSSLPRLLIAFPLLPA